jgi:hypothetical protein
VVEGDDADLARWLAGAPNGLVRFVPSDDSDLARALGLVAPASDPTRELAVDALRYRNGHAGVAVNMIVFGPTPDRLRRRYRDTKVRVDVDGRPWFDDVATTVVVANGEHLRGLDVSPRGHPGDGRAEVQVYSLRRAERRAMRRRLTTGTHVPHPRIGQRTARTVTITTADPQPLEADGRLLGMAKGLTVEVVPAAYRLLV